jgi:hypothetical protein
MLHEIFLVLIGYSDSVLTQVCLTKEKFQLNMPPLSCNYGFPPPFFIQMLLLQLYLNVKCSHHAETSR